MNRSERLAALNGERRTFVCHSCGKVKHVKDAGARVGRSAGLVCGRCISVRAGADILVRNFREFFPSMVAGFLRARVKPFPSPRDAEVVVYLPGDVHEITIKGEFKF